MLYFWLICFVAVVSLTIVYKYQDYYENRADALFFGISCFLIIFVATQVKGFNEISQKEYQEVIDLKETCIKYQSCADVLSDILEDNKIKRYEFDKFYNVLEEEIENEKRMKELEEKAEKEKLNKEILEQIKKELKDKE